MKNWRFLSVATILVVVLAAIIGAGSASAQAVCSPATAISVPFVKDGLGTFCWQAASLCNNINSWNLNKLEINGTSYANIWVLGSSITPLNGVYTITYESTVTQFSHFEINGPCSGGPTLTRTHTPILPTGTGTGRTQTPGITSTRTFTSTSGPTGTGTGRSQTPGIVTRTWTPNGLTPTRTRTSTPSFTPTIDPMPTRTVTPAGDLGWGTVNGTVTDAITGAPLAGVLVTCTHGSIFTPVEEHCVGTYTTGPDGTYIFNNIHFYATDQMTVRVDLAGYESQWFVTQSLFTSANLTKNFAMSHVATPTRTATPGPSLTPTITPTRTITLTPSPTLPGGICAPAETITAPFIFSGVVTPPSNVVGTHCWRIQSFNFMSSFNLNLLSVNGQNFTNVFVFSSSLPPKVDGYWYITHVSTVPWGHFEIQP